MMLVDMVRQDHEASIWKVSWIEDYGRNVVITVTFDGPNAKARAEEYKAFRELVRHIERLGPHQT